MQLSWDYKISLFGNVCFKGGLIWAGFLTAKGSMKVIHESNQVVIRMLDFKGSLGDDVSFLGSY